MELYNSKFVYFEWDDVLEGKDVFLADYISVLKDRVNGNLKAEKVRANGGEDFPFYGITYNETYSFAYYDPNYECKRAYAEGKQIQFKHGNTWKEVAGEPMWDPYNIYRIKPEVKETESNYVEFSVYITYAVKKPCFNIASKKYDSHCYYKGSFEDCNEWVTKHQNLLDMMYSWEKEGKTIQFYDSSECEWSDVENPLWNPSDKYRVKPEEKKVPFENKEELIRKWEAMNQGCKSRPGCANPMIWVKDCAGSYLITGYKDYTVIINGKDITFTQLFRMYTFLDGTVIGKRS